jgi:hypothetical protein
MWPRLRGQAEPAPNAGDHEPEPEFDTQLELTGVPADSNVKHSRLSLPNLSLLIKFRSLRITFTIFYNISLKWANPLLYCVCT